MKTKHHSVILGVFTIALFAKASLQAANYDQMVVFGDSLSDVGNFASVLPPPGLSAFDYDSQRFTDGPSTFPSTAITGVAVEQLDALLGLAPLSPFVAGGSDYAWAKATTATNLPDFLHGVTPGTGTQIGAYLSTQTVSPNSLYVIWAGANDLFNATTPADIANAETTAITNLDTQITTLLAAGARHILWYNVPDLSLTPGGSSEPGPLPAQLHLSSEQFRSDWMTAIAQLDAAFPQADITGVDAFAFLNSLVSQPGDFGLTNATDSAQGLNVNPDTYLFWDGVHPTTAADQDLALFSLHALQPIPEPSTYGLMGAAALIGTAVLRRRTYTK